MYNTMYISWNRGGAGGMGRMVRKQVYIEREQEAHLKRLARDLGVRESELIRRGIAQLSRGAPGAYLDRSAWEAELAFIHERARIPALGRDRGWTREGLYAERLERLSR